MVPGEVSKAVCEDIVKFMARQTSKEDVLLFCSGRCRASRQLAKTWTEGVRRLYELWAVYQAYRRWAGG